MSISANHAKDRLISILAKQICYTSPCFRLINLSISANHAKDWLIFILFKQICYTFPCFRLELNFEIFLKQGTVRKIIDRGGGNRQLFNQLVEARMIELGLPHFDDMTYGQRRCAIDHVRNSIILVSPLIVVEFTKYQIGLNKMPFRMSHRLEMELIKTIWLSLKQAFCEGRMSIVAFSENRRRRDTQLQQQLRHGAIVEWEGRDGRKKREQEFPELDPGNSSFFDDATERSNDRKLDEKFAAEREAKLERSRQLAPRRWEAERRRYERLPRLGNRYDLKTQQQHLAQRERAADFKIKMLKQQLARAESEKKIVQNMKQQKDKLAKKVEETQETARSLVLVPASNRRVFLEIVTDPKDLEIVPVEEQIAEIEAKKKAEENALSSNISQPLLLSNHRRVKLVRTTCPMPAETTSASPGYDHATSSVPMPPSKKCGKKDETSSDTISSSSLGRQDSRPI